MGKKTSQVDEEGGSSRARSAGVGKLIFKGDSSKKKKKTKKITSSSSAYSSGVTHTSNNSNVGIHMRKSDENDVDDSMPMLHTGTGLITSSGTTIMGLSGNGSTTFSSDFRAGDAIVVQHPESGIEEMRVVKMVLSDVSCSISSAFSTDLKAPTSFQYIHAPKDDAKERRIEEEKMIQDKAELDRVAFGTYASAGQKELVYREKSSTGTSYVIRRETLDKEVSRGELLAMRTKKKSDKFC